MISNQILSDFIHKGHVVHIPLEYETSAKFYPQSHTRMRVQCFQSCLRIFNPPSKDFFLSFFRSRLSFTLFKWIWTLYCAFATKSIPHRIIYDRLSEKESESYFSSEKKREWDKESK